MSRKRYNARGITKAQFLVLTGALVTVMAGFIIKISWDTTLPEDKGEYVAVTEEVDLEQTIEAPKVSAGVTEYIAEAIETDPPVVESYGDPNNYIYPFDTMSADWGADLYESGFKYYEIPQAYKDTGGCFPEVVQAYLWILCKDRGVDYYTVVALIERESGYQWDKTGDYGNSKGYMQIYEKWHKDRMQAEGVTDLYNPYQNIRVGLSCLQEIQESYLASSGENCVLMVYNMGETTAKKKWSEGVYSTEYSRAILSRAQEIKQELQE